ncbi:MAG TPA: histidine--tRNA ligase [Longimicrobiales bacterium]|nr:histidine--tRNA ligase [Longimicrobiales bacterium]
MPKFASLPGFRDFYPETYAVRAHIAQAWREAARRYGYREYDGPPLEPLELYVEKSGEEIVRQLYNFVDKGGREVALRPEMTPTLARMVSARAGAMRKPIRWFSIPQLFRYERTQRGRLREHFQWNVDMIGESDVAADAEVLAVALEGLTLLGLTADDVVARISDRRLLEKLLLHAGVPADQLLRAYGVIDKLTREPVERIRARLAEEVGLSSGSVEAVLRIFECPDLGALAAVYGAVDGIAPELERLERYLALLDQMGFGAFTRFDISIVRGLAYYTGIVFEVFDRRGELRAVCGGGRYDELLRVVGDVDLPALGFGMGDVVLGELLAERGLLPETPETLDYYIAVVDASDMPLAYRVARGLRSAGYSVSHALKPAGLGRQLKEADARGAASVVVLGPEEVAAGVATVKDMRSGRERRVPLDELLH